MLRRLPLHQSRARREEERDEAAVALAAPLPPRPRLLSASWALWLRSIPALEVVVDGEQSPLTTLRAARLSAFSKRMWIDDWIATSSHHCTCHGRL